MTGFSPAAAARLKNAHPLLQKLMNAAIKEADFTILDSQRGKAAQELAFKKGNSKVHFGKSAHNWTPALALDIAPLPIDWKGTKKFRDLGLKVIMPLAKDFGIPIRWGGDFNMDGVLTNDNFVDLPHYELHPWREFAKKAKLFEE